MRGKVLKQQSLLLMKRITPAYAGKSGYTRRRTSGRWDHPRLCGEKKYKETKEQWQAGSPPPMRGKVVRGTLQRQNDGITPAYAGKSISPSLSFTSLGDHPRLCGEKRVHPPEDFRQMGSPPPMRGKATPEKYTDQCARITPAYAGKRSGMLRRLISCKDHPRLCGEKKNLGEKLKPCPGSPPPMRGKAACVATLLICKRITPAYAGKSNFRLFL